MTIGFMWQSMTLLGSLTQESGQRVQTVKVIKNELSTNDYEWGYIGRIGDNLIGSATRAETSYKSFWSGKMWYDGKGGDVGTQQVCSDFIFGYSLKASKAKPSWRYEKWCYFESNYLMR